MTEKAIPRAGRISPRIARVENVAVIAVRLRLRLPQSSGAGATTRCSTGATPLPTCTLRAASSTATSRGSRNWAPCGCRCRTFSCFRSSRSIAGGPTESQASFHRRWLTSPPAQAFTGSLGAGFSLPAAALALAFFALNPNLLYLQTTAMTEPLFVCEMIWIVVWLVEWRSLLDEDARSSDRLLGWIAAALVAAIFTRYDGWIMALLAWSAIGVELLRRGRLRSRSLLACKRIRCCRARLPGSFTTPRPLATGLSLRAVLTRPRLSNCAPPRMARARRIPAGTIRGSRCCSF